MKPVYDVLITFSVLLSCKQRNAVTSFTDISSVPVQNRNFHSHELDSTHLLYPTGIFYFDNYVIFIEPKNNPTLSFWHANDLSYAFSSGYKGSGPDEVIQPRANYFHKTDTSFFILDSNIEREMKLKGNEIHIIRNIPILIPDGINQMVRLNDSTYVMSGFNSGIGKQHIRYTTDGDYTFFGDYPDSDVPEEQRSTFFYRFTAGREDKNVLIDFYQYTNLICIYMRDGYLKKQIVLKGTAPRNNHYNQLFDGNIQPFFRILNARKDYIAILYYENTTSNEIYDWTAHPELQIWNWDGELIKRIRFNKSFDNFTISDSNRVYATNRELPYIVYTYDLNI